MKPLHVYFDSAFQIPQLDGLTDQESDSDNENGSLMDWKRVKKKKDKLDSNPPSHSSTSKRIKRTGKKVSL